jgi:cell cycle checkpoint control protein RAD9A
MVGDDCCDDVDMFVDEIWWREVNKFRLELPSTRQALVFNLTSSTMAVLSFSLSPEATGRIYELLICLAKFGESVAIEARSEKLTITALNLSRTAYASYILDAKSFFISYNFNGKPATKGGDRFTCQLLNKALQSVFKGRANDVRGRESTVERCDVSVQDQPDKTECRLVVKMVCKHGMYLFQKFA